MTTEFNMQSAPQGVFRGMGMDQLTEISTIANVQSFDTADTCETNQECARPIEKIAATHKESILKRIRSRSRSRKGTKPEEKKSTGRKIMGRLSFGKRSKAKKVEAEAQKMSSSTTVASEETPILEESGEVQVEVQSSIEVPSASKSVGEAEPDINEADKRAMTADKAVIESEELHYFVERHDTNVAVVSATGTRDASEAVEPETDDVVFGVKPEAQTEDMDEEAPPQKAPFHQDSADFLGLAMVGLLIGLLASPFLHSWDAATLSLA